MRLDRTPRPEALEGDSLETTVETIRALLSDTVKRQLIADVPVATMLSGGLDSSGITALAAREFRMLGKIVTTSASTPRASIRRARSSGSLVKTRSVSSASSVT